MPNGNALRISCAILLLLVSGSCRESVPQLSVESVRAGGSVRLTLPDGHGADDARLTATIGGRAVPVHVRDDAIEIGVPLTKPGRAELRLVQGDRLLLAREILVGESRARRLEFSIGPDGIDLLRSSRSADALTTNAVTRASRLSFDVFNLLGGLVQTGSIPHPMATGGEIFEPAGAPGLASIRRIDPGSAGAFHINVVNPVLGGTLRVYEVRAGLDLGTADGRAERVLLKELTL